MSTEDKIQITVEVDIERVREEVHREIIRRSTNDYFEAHDINDWTKRSEVKEKRIQNIINKVNWDKLPEKVKENIFNDFFNRIIKPVIDR